MAKSLIEAAIPTLQRDLGWGDYLTNLAKEICNAAKKFFSAGRHQGFLRLKPLMQSRVPKTWGMN